MNAEDLDSTAPEGSWRQGWRRVEGPGGETVGQVRRIDSGSSPDRYPSAVTWPDDRRPRPRRVEGPATSVADALRRRLAPPSIEPLETRSLGADGRLRRQRSHTELADPSCRAMGDEDGRLRDARSARTSAHRRRDGVEANARLTGMTAAVIFVLLAVEGLTILHVSALLNVHVFVGMVLVPPVLLKIGTTTWRFARYYLGDPAYRRKGPPPPLFRLLGPVVIVLTLTLLASGVALLLAPPSARASLLFLHKASFVVWLGAMAVHVLGHLLDTARLAPRDWYQRTRRQVKGAGLRQWVVASSLGVGLVLGAAFMPKIGPWLLGGN